MDKEIELLRDFARWYEDETGDDLSSYDQDTTPYAVHSFLTKAQQQDSPDKKRDELSIDEQGVVYPDDERFIG